MSRMLKALTTLFRRWRYLEDGAPEVPRTAASSGSEAQRLRRAIASDERLIADYRKNGCPGLAKERESSLRILRSHLAALEL